MAKRIDHHTLDSATAWVRRSALAWVSRLVLVWEWTSVRESAWRWALAWESQLATA